MNPTQIGCGRSHSVFIDEEGNLWGIGESSKGQLGVDLSASSFTFHKIDVQDVIQTVCSDESTTALRSDGTVFAFGDNEYGHLSGNKVAIFYPQQILSIQNITMVAAGMCHLLFLDGHGVVWGCGSNAKGQLGLNTNQILQFNTPAPIKQFARGSSSISIVTKVFAFADRSFLVNEDRELFAFGSNEAGALGINTAEDTAIRPTKVRGVENVALVGSSISDLTIIVDESGGSWYCGQLLLAKHAGKFRFKPEPLSIGFLPTSIACGDDCFVATDAGGSLWIFGLLDTTEECLQWPNFTRIEMAGHFVSVAGFCSHFFATTLDEKLYGFGENGDGQVNPLSDEPVIFPPEEISLPFKLKTHETPVLIKSARK